MITSQQFQAYQSIFLVGFVSLCFYRTNNGLIILIEEEMSEMFVIQNGELVSIGFEWDYPTSYFVPATRKEIKAAGLWEYVINKDDYSSEQDKIETELDEYLRIGEEMEKKKDIET